MVSRAITLHSVVPVRADASECAEQVTQMLFAETCDVLQTLPRWTKIRLHADGQQGWVDTKMLTPLSEQEYQLLPKDTPTTRLARIAMPMAYAVSESNGQTFPLTGGTTLPNYRDGVFAVLGATLRVDPTMVIEHPYTLTQEKLMQVVRFYLNIPYLWGGKNAMGLDCSGFTQVIYSLFGHSLPRNASEQVQVGTPILANQVQAGDLAFFDHADINPDQTNISHVGILLDKERIIHCSGRVKVEKWNAQGILSMEAADTEHPQGYYTHHLAAIRRL